jgi:hypothetical protein
VAEACVARESASRRFWSRGASRFGRGGSGPGASRRFWSSRRRGGSGPGAQAGVEQGRVLAGEMSRGASVAAQGGRRPPSLWRQRRKEAGVLSWRRRRREEVRRRGPAARRRWTASSRKGGGFDPGGNGGFVSGGGGDLLRAGQSKSGEGANEQGSERPLCLGRRRVDAGGNFRATPARPSREARFELLTRAGLRGPFRAKWAVPG